MTRLVVNGTELYCEVRGAGLPILGIHGTPSSARIWAEATERLAALGRAIVYDRRGFDRSPFDAATLDLDQHVADAAELLKALDAVPAVVIGRSTGGLIALELAVRHPEAVRALVLLEPAIFSLDDEVGRWAAELRETILREAPSHRHGASGVVFDRALGPHLLDSMPEDLRHVFVAGSGAVLAEIRGTGLDLSVEPRRFPDDVLARLTLPCLVVVAEDSSATVRRPGERLAELMPNAELVKVPGGHLIDPALPEGLRFIEQVAAGGTKGTS